MCVISIRKHLSFAALVATRGTPASRQRRVDVLGRRDLKSLHATSERGLAARLDDHVDVVALNAEVHDPEPVSTDRAEGGLADREIRIVLAK